MIVQCLMSARKLA